MIRPMTSADIGKAAEVYSLSWVGSHRSICNETVLQRHTPQKKADDLKRLLGEGWSFWMYEADGRILGLIGSHPESSEIAYLYILPAEQGKGIGGQLLCYVIGQMGEKQPRLWTLNSNRRAEAVYAHYGFVKTGNVHILNEQTGLFESEWILPKK